MTLARKLTVVALVVTFVALAAVVVGPPVPSLDLADADAPLPRADSVAVVEGAVATPPIAPGFVGVSIEFQGLGDYVAHGRNRVLEKLLAGLSPGQAPVVRIGGDSSDHSWWPARGLPTSPGLQYALTPSWASGVARLVHDIRARVILGINLEADSGPLAAVMAHQLVARIGPRYVQALELGNEPSLYGVLPWYVDASGRRVLGRQHSYSPAAYEADFARVVARLPRLPLAAPALGDANWMSLVPPLLRKVPRIREVTFHRYPMNRCGPPPDRPTYASMAHMLSPLASEGLAASVAPFVATARRHHVRFRVAEMNSVACEGKQGVSDTFGSALWALDAVFAMARQGVAGVNFHTFPGGRYRLFSLWYRGGIWRASVAPVYYGLLMFARAAPPRSRLLRVRLRASSALRVWATRQAGSGTTRVTLINVSRRRHVVQVNLPGAPPAAVLEELRAPALASTSGVTLGGQRFPDGTATGKLGGGGATTKLARAGRGYRVVVPGSSAILLTVAAG